MRKLALLIGLNEVNPYYYNGWKGTLVSPEKDARDMQEVMLDAGFLTTVLLGPNANVANFEDYIYMVAKKQLIAGDELVIHYSGHGGSVPDVNRDEKDALDETWCFYNGMILDDYISYLLAEIDPGVKITVLSDSCHSATIAKSRYAIKSIPNDIALTICTQCNKQRSIIQGNRPKPNIITMSGCQDHEYSYDGPENGVFTGAILKVLKSEPTVLTWNRMINAVRSLVSGQTPTLTISGDQDLLYSMTPFYFYNANNTNAYAQSCTSKLSNMNNPNLLVKNAVVSWKTTLFTIIAALPLILAQIGYAFDTDPLTNIDFNILIPAIGGLVAGILAKDGDVSSEQVAKGWS